MSDTESDFQPEKAQPKSKSKEHVKEPKQKAGKKSAEKVKEPKGKQKGKKKKQSKTKKQSKGKKGEEDTDDALSVVKDYMEKQNRPYNLLNVFDNLHGKIKKGPLEEALNKLTEQKALTCKEFGKNKVYFLNQDQISVSRESIEELGHNYTEIRAEEKELSDRYKQLSDELKKLTVKKTIHEIQEMIEEYKEKIVTLKEKKKQLLSEGSIKIDEAVVSKIQNDEIKLRKEVTKRKKLTKECLSLWSEITEKKIAEVADMMGVQL